MLRKLVGDPPRDSREAHPSRMDMSSRIAFMKTNVSHRILDLVPEVSVKTRERVSEIVAHKRTVFGQFFPLLLDDEVEEIYVDRPGSLVYFDHSRLGRCVSQCAVTEDEAGRIVTSIRSESNLHADRMNPSLKTDFRIVGVPFRFSMTLPPLSPDGVSLEIRKPRRRAYTILELVSNDTLTPVGAALLVLAVCSRFNITITGAPGCGKTTLMNALDMITPSNWRKVYIEDAAESRAISGHHQVKLQVDPIDETRNRLNKSMEIVKTLHRSPDYLVLGEIQSAEHSRALFQAISAGLSSIQTCHSNSGAGLVSRWSNDHGIEKSSIALMDVIVTMDRPEPGMSKRCVTEIAEIRRGFEDGLMLLRGLNVLYRSGQRCVDDVAWAEDGAFRLKGRQYGPSSHADACRFLAEVIERAVENPGSPDSCSLGNVLWRNGHPICLGNRKEWPSEKGS
jgi:Flp pilus assembly CpaF family ATPase